MSRPTYEGRLFSLKGIKHCEEVRVKDADLRVTYENMRENLEK